MKDAFISYISENNLCKSTDHIMLAVSGGIDSVCMTDLFYRAGYSFSILHCNFGLRGQDSDDDEEFVKRLANKYSVEVYIERFATNEYSEENNISIQMAARDLRYNWFNEISDENDVNHIATAHNLNDTIETCLLNLCRGTGLKGLCGIPIKNNKYIRPVLFASRKEIETYMQEYSLSYKEDSSNSETKYFRNKIRHQILPVMEEINQSILHTFKDNIAHFNESYEIFSASIDETRRKIFSKENDLIKIDIEELKKLEPFSTWLFELFAPYGFNAEQCKNIKSLIESESGKQICSTSYCLYKDRKNIYISKHNEKSEGKYYIDSIDSDIVLPIDFKMKLITKDAFPGFSSDPKIALLDYDKLNFPLILRHWKPGDYFYPLGMNQIKKISDFFIDNKVPVPIKERTWILTSGRHIIWICGFRIDNRYKITEETTNILQIKLF